MKNFCRLTIQRYTQTRQHDAIEQAIVQAIPRFQPTW